MKKILLSILVMLSGTAAMACDEYISLDRAQTREMIGQLRSADVDPLEQFFAFETLMCSDQAGIRDLSLRVGAASPNPTIQGQVLLRAMLEKEVVPVELLEVEGLTKEQYEQIKSNPTVMLAITYRDSKLGCMSFDRDGECPPGSVASITGTSLVIHIAWNNRDVDGNFRLVGDHLEGTFNYKGMTFPARIELF